MAINNSTYIVNDGGSTKNLRYGSTGNDVKQLQKQLQAAGYDVGKSGADGVYGSATANAVKQFQKDNGLAVDGIAGGNTKSALIKSSSSSSNPHYVLAADAAVTGAKIAAGTNPAPAATNTNNNTSKQPAATQPATKQPTATTPAASTPATPTATPTEPAAKTQAQFTYDDFSYGDFSYGSYAQSDTVQQAWALLQQQNAAKPGAYQSQWQDEINDYLNQIQNRDPFSYDFNSDALYQQYKNNYIQQGQMAMMDTMGQAAAMTGGYGNSYAQTVGQQAYNQQLNQLNNMLPEFYNMAFDRYAYEGQQLKDNLNMYMGLEDQDYGRYMDSYNAWQAERDYLANRYDVESTNDYNRYVSDRELAYNQYTADKNLAYDQYNAGREQAWNEYVANQEKEMAAAELMAGAGNYDRLADVYGLTDDEVATIKDANTPKYNGTPKKEEKTLTLDQAGTLQDIYKRSDGAADAMEFSNYYGAMLGVNPSYVYGALGAAGLLGGKEIVEPPQVPTEDEEEEEKRRHVGTPSGGNFYYELR